MERKLAAILSADVAGYSRLVEDDDEATIATLTRYRELMRVAIEAHHGRVVDTPGDNLLAEFGSVVDAVRCAVELQQSLRAQNEHEQPHRRMQFRMGINVGDVVVEGDSLYGDGVNIAARLEALADPGGICLSGNAIEQVENKVDIEFEFVGEQHVKNISKNISVWRAKIGEDALRTSELADAEAPSTRDRTKVLVIAMVIVVVIAGSAVLFKPTVPPSEDPVSVVTPVTRTQNSAAPEQTERPAIIVLPFANMSDDPEQEYFSDGFTEDITTDLSKLDSIYVVSNNAASKYKGKPVDASMLKEEHGVRYFLEGSVRKVGDQIRINARLNDVTGNQHLWGERYDRPYTDIFAVQDEIRGKILTALRVNLTDVERQRFNRAPTTNLEAYDFYLRAQEMTQRARRELRPELMDAAANLYKEAISLDSEYAAAYGALGMVHRIRWLYNWNDDGNTATEKALNLFEKARALDESNPNALRYTINAQLQTQQFDQAIILAQRYVELLPQDPEAHLTMGLALSYFGRLNDALTSLTRSKELYPGRVPPFAYWIYGIVYSFLDRDEEALEILKEATLRAPNYLTNQIILAFVYSKLGREAEAQMTVKEILRISPGYETAHFRKGYSTKDPSITDSIVAALRKAGLP